MCWTCQKPQDKSKAIESSTDLKICLAARSQNSLSPVGGLLKDQKASPDPVCYARSSLDGWFRGGYIAFLKSTSNREVLTSLMAIIFHIFSILKVRLHPKPKYWLDFQLMISGLHYKEFWPPCFLEGAKTPEDFSLSQNSIRSGPSNRDPFILVNPHSI